MSTWHFQCWTIPLMCKLTLNRGCILCLCVFSYHLLEIFTIFILNAHLSCSCFSLCCEMCFVKGKNRGFRLNYETADVTTNTYSRVCVFYLTCYRVFQSGLYAQLCSSLMCYLFSVSLKQRESPKSTERKKKVALIIFTIASFFVVLFVCFLFI